jgi:hypothetical protein
MIKLDRQISFIKLKEKGADELDKPLYGSVLRTLQKLADAEKFEDGEYAEYVEVYHEFFFKKYGFKPLFDGTQGKPLKAIIKYLNAQSKEGKGITVWKLLLDNWDLQNDFMQKQCTVAQIKKYITEMLAVLKKKYKDERNTTDELEELRRRAAEE